MTSIGRQAAQPANLIRAAVLALFVIPAPAQAVEQFSCVVDRFLPSGDDATFAAKNARKTFDLLVKKDEIIAFVRSKDFKNSETRYQIIDRGTLDMVAIETNISGLSSLVLPVNPASRLKSDGYFNATISLQSRSFINTWLLRCVE
ncbi:hypothetical protein O4H61_06215 [Roseovarius aestuarii]|nr:hypothetical protein [Roseovarius aestuarii]